MKKLAIILLTPILVFSCAEDRKFPEVQNINTFPNTDFVEHLNVPITQDKNQVYCVTLTYAWHELEKELGKITVDSCENLKALNDFTGYQNSLLPEEVDNDVQVQGSQIIATSKFNKSLPFETEFEKDNYKLKFDNQAVQSFGTSEETKTFEVLYYENKESFAVRLLPKDKKHQITLYTSSDVKGNSLQELLTTFQTKETKHKEIETTEDNYWRYTFLEHSDVLSIPALQFNLEKNYTEMLGCTIQNGNYFVEKMYQRTALILDEKGAEVESEAVVAVTETATMPIENEMEPKHLIFNKPFLITFQRTDTNQPYLVAWIYNTDFMTLKK